MTNSHTGIHREREHFSECGHYHLIPVKPTGNSDIVMTSQPPPSPPPSPPPLRLPPLPLMPPWYADDGEVRSQVLIHLQLLERVFHRVTGFATILHNILPMVSECVELHIKLLESILRILSLLRQLRISIAGYEEDALFKDSRAKG